MLKRIPTILLLLVVASLWWVFATRELAPNEIFMRMRTKYVNAESYRDTGTYTKELEKETLFRKSIKGTFRTAYQSPQKFIFDIIKKTKTDQVIYRGICWSDSKQSRSYSSATQTILERSTPEIASHDPDSLVPSMLMPYGDISEPISFQTHWRRGEDLVIDGNSCYCIISGKREESQVTFWIEKESYLLRCYERVVKKKMEMLS